MAKGTSLGQLTQVGPALTASALTPRFGLLWRPENWVSFYCNYAEGFGPNSGYIYPGSAAPPTSAREEEAGVKLEFFDGKLRATADYYNLTKTNLLETDPLHPGFSLLIGAARSKGPELDVQGTLLPGWDVILAYANQDVKVTQATDGTEGERLNNVPQNLGSFWTTYEFQDKSLNLKGLKIGGGVIYHGIQPVFAYGGNFQGASANVAGYATVSLMGAYSFKFNGVKLTAQLNVTNLLDATYYTAGYVFASPAATPGYVGGSRTYGAPRAFLGSLKAEF